MKTKNSAVILTIALLILLILYSFSNAISDTGNPGTDLVPIDAMKIFDELERPAVLFPHDLHTVELEKRGEDCSVCHSSEDGNLILKFGRKEDIDQETTLDVYHDKCIGCHEESYNADLPTGPVECGECHVIDPVIVASQQDPNFDASLHYRHIEAQKDQCESCHHGYDETTKKQVYTKGEEESCKSCHGPETLDEVISYRLASHQSCISCHQETKDSGPVDCSGCHDATEIKNRKIVENPPRLDRNQPDNTFLKSFEKIDDLMMNAVLFNHQAHENAIDSCRTCHHENLDSCESCHSISGKVEGDFVTLPQAMHDVKSEYSCVGCHSRELQEPKCVSCHSLVVNEFAQDIQNCQNCHSVSLEAIKQASGSGGEVDAGRFQAGNGKETRIDFNDAPDTIDIDIIADDYEGAFFPHKVIIDALMEGIKGNRLAEHFHQGENTICGSCHHNSPDDLKSPPKCSSCHSPSSNDEVDSVPGLKEAYHQQCFGCHDAIEIAEPASTDCVDCHVEK